ncbi:MAG: hypothetical protein JWQ90_1801 [Hydrocarboniphaga sp.]|uniref:hypothetical protein n=1 Tax=Hydrocarboniphaga sp. TaxID=2033016 RepID=UPI00260246D4|nr:hypothetical protein [Hydrocarboniphaga sp.]MDB5969351.1 hypothetical protein [Hydrocarboniphaga sp.]
MPNFALPEAGDVVLCRFPENIAPGVPGPKARPGIVIETFEHSKPGAAGAARICYGTSVLTKLYPGEFTIEQKKHPIEYKSAGIRDDTRFNLCNIAKLPYNATWFKIPNFPSFGQKPKLGTIHAQTMPRLMAAAAECKKGLQRLR